MTVTVDSAGVPAELAFLALIQARLLTDSLRNEPAAEGIYDETTAGPNGGSMQLQGRIAPDGTGWYINDYSDFRDGDVTINGSQVTHILRMFDGEIAETRVDWHHFRVTSPDFDQTLQGSVSRVEDDFSSATSSDINVVLTDLPSAAQLLLESIQLRSRKDDSGFTFEVHGRVFDSTLGYVDAATAAPLSFESLESTAPYAGGPYVVTGQNGASVWLEPLSHLYASLQFSMAENILPRLATRVVWDTPFFLQVGLPGSYDPVAISGPDGFVLAGKPQVLDGRMSHHSDGALHGYRWRLLFAPPGSKAEVEKPAGFKTTFTPDLPGSYLVMLEVNDGVHTARDTSLFFVDPDKLLSDDNDMRFALPPDRTAGVSERLILDGSMFFPLSRYDPDELTYRWSVTRYSQFNEKVAIENGDSSTPSFIADEPGLYVVSGQVSGTFSGDFATATQIIAVGRALPPLAATAPTPFFGTRNDITAGDLTGDGIDDIVLSHVGNHQSDLIPRIYVYPGTGGGRFAAPVSVEGGTGDNVVAIDIGADRRMDVATLTVDGIELFRQDQGRLQSIGVMIENPFTCFSTKRPYRSLVVGDLNADGLQDLVTQHSCRRHVDVFFQLADGSFGAPAVSQPIPEAEFSMLNVADITNDGVDDVMVVVPADRHDETKTQLILAPGSREGPLVPGVIMEIDDESGDLPLLEVGDLNKDGRTDAIVAVGGTFFIYLQNEVGELLLDQQFDGFTRFVALTDIDGDDRLDIYTYIEDASIYRQHEDGTFSPEEVFYPLEEPDYRQTGNFDPVAIADLNGDGIDELVVAKKVSLEILFARQPLICGQSCSSSEDEKRLEQLASDGQKPLMQVSREPLAFSRDRIMNAYRAGANTELH